jgi:hypothetical protein
MGFLTKRQKSYSRQYPVPVRPTLIEKAAGWGVTRLCHWKLYHFEFPELGLCLGLSRMKMDDALFAAMEPKIQKAFTGTGA